MIGYFGKRGLSGFSSCGTQIQTFTCDTLDHLISAIAGGGTGGTYTMQNYVYDTQGRLEINATVTNYYENTAHIHAVSRTSTGNTYSYDQNGNQTSRKVSGITYTLVYDAENRLVQIKRGSDIQATYTYDGDGNRVKTVVGSTTTTYVGNYLEWSGSTTTMKKYTYAGGQRIAMRQGSSTLYYLLTDHRGSTAITATSGGGWYGELRYYPWGGTRYSSGTTPTDYRFTGQQEIATIGLYFYNSRFYDAALGRFVSPDSIIPHRQGSQAWDRYAGMNNNPIRYKDPSGHDVCNEDGNCFNKQGWYRAPNETPLNAIDTLKMMILETYGISISDAGGKRWDTRNLYLMYRSLGNIDNVLTGRFSRLVWGATFRLSEYIPTPENCSLPDLSCQYYGWTSLQNITFYTIGNDAIRQMNIYHEVGHLIEHMPGMIHVFSTALEQEVNKSYINTNGYIDKLALLTLTLTTDPNYDYVQARQASGGDMFEQWADIFANYIAGNINMDRSEGQAMNNFVTRVLSTQYTYVP
jgi:RHS repeat-associated protein